MPPIADVKVNATLFARDAEVALGDALDGRIDLSDIDFAAIPRSVLRRNDSAAAYEPTRQGTDTARRPGLACSETPSMRKPARL